VYLSIIIPFKHLTYIDTSVLMDTLVSLHSHKSHEQIGEFVRGGGVALLIEAINTKGINKEGAIRLMGCYVV
jgi:hypothetical protein